VIGLMGKRVFDCNMMSMERQAPACCGQNTVDLMIFFACYRHFYSDTTSFVRSWTLVATKERNPILFLILSTTRIAISTAIGSSEVDYKCLRGLPSTQRALLPSRLGSTVPFALKIAVDRHCFHSIIACLLPLHV
jgi:hypothetical protein